EHLAGVLRSGLLDWLDLSSNCVMRNVCTPILIFFGTNRKREDAPEHISFGGERDKPLMLGSAFVTVPKAHGRGQLERPSYWSGLDLLRGLKEDSSSHFVISKNGVYVFNSVENFVAAMLLTRRELRRFNDHAFVFVHGYNTSVESALYRTAQIAFDLGALENGIHVP